ARDTADAGECLEELGAVAELFVQGYQLNYGDLFAGGGYRRIPLPTYPFARERYWVSNPPARSGNDQATPAPSAVLADAPATVFHPLVHARCPDLPGRRYRSTFTGEEFFLADHVVQGVRILPAMAYVEMARAAVSDARRS